jgi:SEC-C motif
MPLHPSLLAPLALPASLKAKQIMKRNEICWCGSGLKWKKCHRDRETRSEVNFGAMKAAMHSEVSKGYCSHPDAGSETCGDKRIGAHTVQRRGGLAAIAEASHVLSVKGAYDDLEKNDGEIIPRLIGLKSASTFQGFCNVHDNAMFKPIECKEVALDAESTFLLSFRAISYELFMKRFALRFIAIDRKSDNGKPFFVQKITQEKINISAAGIKRGLEGFESWKEIYDTNYRLRNYSGHDYYGVIFDRILPVVGCGVFNPEWDFHGVRLQNLVRGKVVMSMLL